MSARLTALNHLMGKIHGEVDAGASVPCVEPERGHWWLSEDPELIEAAANLCHSCPALDACHLYVVAFPEQTGVWAGVAQSAPTFSRRST